MDDPLGRRVQDDTQEEKSETGPRKVHFFRYEKRILKNSVPFLSLVFLD